MTGFVSIGSGDRADASVAEIFELYLLLAYF